MQPTQAQRESGPARIAVPAVRRPPLELTLVPLPAASQGVQASKTSGPSQQQLQPQAAAGAIQPVVRGGSFTSDPLLATDLFAPMAADPFWG